MSCYSNWALSNRIHPDGGSTKKKRLKDPQKLSDQDIAAAKRYVINLMTTQSLIGMQILVENIQEQVPAFESEDAVRLIHALCDTNRLQMLDPNAQPKDQLLCWVPS